MIGITTIFFLTAFCVESVWLHNVSCEIDLECAECIPDNMPLVVQHSDRGVTLSCEGGRFMTYPGLQRLQATCEEGRYRVQTDQQLRHLLELGCQENLFEDVLHHVPGCGAPYQGRMYQLLMSRDTRHYVELCYDADRAVALSARMHAGDNKISMSPHEHHTGPLSLLGNFNHMFDTKTRHDAERLYSDDRSTNKRLKELLKHDHISFAGQTLTSAKLLSSHYFEREYMRVTNFVSNRVAAWRSVAEGNLRHLHNDVAALIKQAHATADLNVYAGTHGVATLRTNPQPIELYLKTNKRFPVPKYIWTVVHNSLTQKAVALILLNDPFVAVSEIKDSVFCESLCSKITWLAELTRNRNYETPLYGLVFCCSVNNASIVREMPSNAFRYVPPGESGLLTDL